MKRAFAWAIFATIPVLAAVQADVHAQNPLEAELEEAAAPERKVR